MNRVQGKEKRPRAKDPSEKMKDRVQRNNGSCGFEVSLDPLTPRPLEPYKEDYPE
jgi:hypothetical protein